MELTLVKTRTFKLEPYGKFRISMARKAKGYLPNIIPLHELDIDHDTSMPFTEQQEKDIIKLMKANKTDILTDGSYFGFYTRAGGGEFASLCHIRHPKLIKYREDESFKELVDGE
jgi:hypothetical protein